MRSRINRCYKDLREIELELEAGASPAKLKRQLAELDRLEALCCATSCAKAAKRISHRLEPHVLCVRLGLVCDDRRP
jgi:hypothetical protein